MKDQTFVYSGRDNLTAMRAAVRYNQFLASLVERHSVRGRWLDFGAGEGQFSVGFVRQGQELVAVEVDDHLAARNEAAGVSTFRSIAEVPDGSIDYIYSLNVLEHIDNDALALAQLRAKLKVGGRMLIYVPAFQSLYSSMDRLVGHHRRYSRSGLTALARNCGLAVIESRYVDSLGFFASAVYKALPSRDGTITSEQVARYDRMVFPLSIRLDSLFGQLVGKNVYLVATRTS